MEILKASIMEIIIKQFLACNIVLYLMAYSLTKILKYILLWLYILQERNVFQDSVFLPQAHPSTVHPVPVI